MNVIAANTTAIVTINTIGLDNPSSIYSLILEINMNTMISLVLGSYSVSDIRQIKDRGFWTHTCLPKASEGDLIVIRPTKKALDLGEGTTSVIAEVSYKPFLVTPQVWSSTSSSEEEFVAQIGLKNIREVPFNSLPPYVKNAALSRTGVRYLYKYIVYTSRKKGDSKPFKVLKLTDNNYLPHYEFSTKSEQQTILATLNNRSQ